MSHPTARERPAERIVLVFVNTDAAEDEYVEAELEGLCEAAGAVVQGSVRQRVNKPTGRTFIGKGKVEEITSYAAELEADTVVIDTELSGIQIRHLEEEIGKRVIDRTQLILDIFAHRAKTSESRLAVEMAQLEYSLPRLKRMWTHLSRMKMGVGTRGPGEKQLEVDRRLVEKRIVDLRRQLTDIQKRKERAVAGRHQHMTVSLVGYTNAGKSTLMNALTDAGVLVEDKLFATLDTRTRRWNLPGWGPVLLSDTVGFIRDLPHHLIASFRATLEEARQADLLLHVADTSSPQCYEQISAVYKVLEELGIEAKDTLLVLNKIDALPDRARIDGLRRRYPNAVAISAVTGDGMREFAMIASNMLSRNFRDVDVETGVENGQLLAYLASHGKVLSHRYHEDRVIVHCRIPEKYLGHVEQNGTVVRPHESNEKPLAEGVA